MGANGFELARWASLAIVVAALVAVLAACGSSSSSTSTTAAPAKNAAPASSAASVQEILRDDEESSIADFLAGLAKDPAKNFIMEQLGLPTTESQLKELSKKIDALAEQLTNIGSVLSAQINELGLQNRLDYLKDQAANLDSMYADYLVPLVKSLIAVKVAEAKTPKDQKAIDDAIADFNTHKTEFLNYANSIQVTALAAKFHDRLQPGTGPGVLRQYGTFIMDKHRILNLGDSQRELAMYQYLEDYQALAAWMTVERAIAVGGTSKDTIKRTLDTFFNWRKDQRDPNKPNALLPQIPAGVAIDRGPAAQSYSTTNKAMFTYLNGMYAYSTWDDAAWKKPTPPTVQSALQRANGTKLKGFTGWRVPSEAELGGLFSGLTDRTPAGIAAYVGGVFGNVPVPKPWLWDSDTSDMTYCYYDAKHRDHCKKRQVHRGASTDNLSWDPHPRYSGFVNLDEQYRAAQGGLFPMRRTGELESYL